ncbi:ribosomal protein S18-alanine N-acetyltransferase [Trichormus azollae]|uniref:Ribosomal-protein-alanine acetyltransferase n=1 Tax=Nostoc azollae (strain 0708) TaxID=551115 RepID=D7DXV5_NOSA0|nr:ribosomal protein S18-alanine N-acetyltransferase [Trichormus azollae]ADI65931.1 ribosomal-protein-alanine acetyltransferase ['Nostoc azollae' 0708]
MKLLDLKIQSLTPEHLGELLELDKACFNGLWTMDGYGRELESPNSHFLGLFSPFSSSGLLGMGCIWSILEEAHITILAVHPQYHRQGLGQALLYSLLKTASDCGLERATLEVRASNNGAISLYEKFGFKIAGRRPCYYKDNEEDALILWVSDLQQPKFFKILDDWHSIVKDRLSQSCWSVNAEEVKGNSRLPKMTGEAAAEVGEQ